MLSQVARFELRYQLTSPIFWITSIIFLVLTYTLAISDDLRIGVDELVVMMVEGGDGADLTMRFEITDSEVRVSAQTPASPEGEAERFVLSEQILGVVADTYSVSTDRGVLVASLTKRAS